MSYSLLDLEYPVQNLWHNWEVAFVDNDTIKWKGQSAFIIDAKSRVFTADGLVLSTPWYHCAKCDQRLSISAKFCPECGTGLDWEHTERSADDWSRIQAEVEEKIAAAKSGVWASDEQ